MRQLRKFHCLHPFQFETILIVSIYIRDIGAAYGGKDDTKGKTAENKFVENRSFPLC